MFPLTKFSSYAWILALSIQFAVLLWWNQYISPHPDMLDHWWWSQHMSWGYYEHPMMVAVVFKLISWLIGDHESALELGSLLVNFSILGLCYAICRRVFDQKTAFLYLLLLQSTPYFFVGAVFTHIDQPYLLCWMASLWFWIRFIETQNNKYLLWIGLFTGLGALSKYIMLLFYIGMYIYFLIYPSMRKHLWNPWLYAGGSLSLLIFSPTILWNYQNDWVSFLHQFGRGASGGDFGENAVPFTLGQLLLFSLVWSVYSITQAFKQRKVWGKVQTKESAILIVSIFPLFFFTIMSFFGSLSDPHWVNITYMGLFMLVAYQLIQSFHQHKGRIQLFRLFAIGAMLQMGILVFLFLHTFQPVIDDNHFRLNAFGYLAQQNIPTATLDKLKKVHNERYLSQATFSEEVQKHLSPSEWSQYSHILIKAGLLSNLNLGGILGWNETQQQLIQIVERANIQPEYVISREYQLGSAIAYWLPSRPWPHSIEKPERNQWSPQEEVRKGRSIFVCRVYSCDYSKSVASRAYPMEFRLIGEIETEAMNRPIRFLQLYEVTWKK